MVERSSSTASEKPVPEKVEKHKHDYDYTTFVQVFKEHQSMEQSSIGSYYVRGFTRFMQKVTTKASGICLICQTGSSQNQSDNEDIFYSPNLSHSSRTLGKKFPVLDSVCSTNFADALKLLTIFIIARQQKCPIYPCSTPLTNHTSVPATT